jgi:hypothetical protein
MRDRLSAFKGEHTDTYKMAWTGKFRGSPTKWSQSDGEAVVEAILAAQANPIVREIDPAKLKYRPKTVETKIGLVSVPDAEPEIASTSSQVLSVDESKDVSAHTEVQALLLRLGSEMGFDIWVARNDRSRTCGGQKFSEFPRIKDSLPLQFDEVTNRTIELIDVLWLNGHAIIAAFEIESTTSIYSGLLRMADLIAMQPNLNIPLYLVAPEERREKVFAEVNRPTFSRLSPRLSEICRFISFGVLRSKLEQVQPFIRFLKPDFIEELAESCDLEV